jgi:ABC-type bacteriocin/lantibiotic exporter with double-glycine peptidase domain
MRPAISAFALAACVVAAALCPSIPRAAAAPPLKTLAPSHTIERVPFVRQQANGCGAAALESVLRHYGLAASQRDIERDVALPNGEILNLDLKLYARRNGLRAESRRGDATLLKAWIARDVPVICQVRLGGIEAPRNHFVVVFGYDDRKLVLVAHTGDRAAEQLSYLDFASAWRDAQNWMLVIRPPARADLDQSGPPAPPIAEAAKAEADHPEASPGASAE